MSRSHVLGVADVGDDTLVTMMGATAVHDVVAVPTNYGLTTMTTAARYWVTGTADRPEGATPFRLFVKVVQSVTRSPILRLVPPEHRAMAEANLPWRVEPDVYASSLGDHLPPKVRMPRCLGVVELDDQSAAIWLEAVDADTGPWSTERYRAAGELLGRLAATPGVCSVADDVGHVSGPHQARVHWEGRLRELHGRAYRDGAVFSHPSVARHVDAELQDRLLSLLDAAPALVREIEELPLLCAHGDACPQNLLPVGDGWIVIDWGFFGRGRLGFDLAQLVFSEIDLGRGRAVRLRELQDAALDGHRRGLAAAGHLVDGDALRRAHDVQVALANGVAAIPVEQLGEPAGVLDPLVAERATALRLLLDAIDL